MTNSKDEIAVTSEVGGSGMDAVGKGTQKTSVVIVSALNWGWVHRCSLFGHYAVPILSMTDLDLRGIIIKPIRDQVVDQSTGQS